MKTIGELLSRARHERGFTVEKLSGLTRIDTRFIKALEENNFSTLPSVTFARGFVRNLAKALDKDPEEMLAVFRRDYHYAHQPLSALSRPRPFHLRSLFNSQFAFLALGILVFLTYLAFQYRAVITPPHLVIESPKDGAVTISPLTLEGETDSGTLVTVNDSLKITPDSAGKFATKLNLAPGQGVIKVTATSRFSRTASKTINLTILSQ